MLKKLEQFDLKFILLLRKYGDEFARFALFVIFFWFGVLKVIDSSPAGPLVVDLLEKTFLNFIDPQSFVRIFGVFEVLVAFLVIIPKLERITFLILLFHLCTTVMPLFIIPHVVWDSFLVPNLTGQYIIKNIALLSLGLLLFAHLKPMTKTHSMLATEEY